MNKVFVYIILIFIFCSCNNNTGLISPLEELKLGMRKGKALSKIEFYKNEGIIDEIGMISIAGEQAEISFYYCRDCFGYTLEAITLKSDNIESLFQKLKNQNESNNYILEMHIISDPTDIIVSPSETLICIYTDKIKYEERGLIGCKKKDTDPCW